MAFTATATITINAAPDAVWSALTDPAMIKQFMFGSEVTSDWQKGSQITYRGEWKGEVFEDKGVILDIEPPHLLRTDYWSRAFGPDDKPENHRTVTYALDPEGDAATKLTVTQENSPTQEEADHSHDNWGQMLVGLKDLLEQ